MKDFLTFYKEYEFISEAKKTKIKQDERLVKMLYHKIKIISHKEEKPDGNMVYQLHVISQLDPLIKGYISYPNEKDLDMIFGNLKKRGIIIDFLYRYARDFTAATKWMQIVNDEVRA